MEVDGRGELTISLQMRRLGLGKNGWRFKRSLETTPQIETEKPKDVNM